MCFMHMQTLTGRLVSRLVDHLGDCALDLLEARLRTRLSFTPRWLDLPQRLNSWPRTIPEK